MSDAIYKALAFVGGLGVVIIAIATLLGYIFREYFKQLFRQYADIAVENFSQQLGRSQARLDKYFASQFDAYHVLWKSLQELRRIGVDLWRHAEVSTVERFANQLRATEKEVDDGALFFEEDHYNELSRILKEFGEYGTGKKRLVEIRSRNDINDFLMQEIERQIAQNLAHKRAYEELLGSILRSFRNRLSTFNEV